MVVVKTDDEIYLNVERFHADSYQSFSGPGLYISTADSDLKVISCDAEKARRMLGDIAYAISRFLVSSDVLVFEIHDGKISRL